MLLKSSRLGAVAGYGRFRGIVSYFGPSGRPSAVTMEPRARAVGTMTNMGAWCVAALLVLAAPAWASATLRGVVVRDREHGEPLARVELTALGANPVTTGNDGQFVLTFPQGHPGQDVAIRVSRVGWAVVNDVLLDRQLPEATNARLFEVIICASDEREQH